MTDSTPDDKNLTEEDATVEETVEAAEADETEADEAPTAKVSTKKAPAAKKRPRPAPPVDEDEDEDLEDDEEETVVVRRRPRPAASRPAARKAVAAAPAAARGTVTTVVITLVTVALVAASITFGALWWNKRGQLSDLQNTLADKAKAEQVAGTYAKGASTFDYRDLSTWHASLTAGVSDELKKRLTPTFEAMNQLLLPLQWVSTSTLLDAVVSSTSGSIYAVNVYVEVNTTTVQIPAGRTTVTVYNVTMDKSKDWQITDVGGAGNKDVTSTGAPSTPAPTVTAPAQTGTSPAQPTSPAAPAATTPAQTGGN